MSRGDSRRGPFDGFKATFCNCVSRPKSCTNQRCKGVRLSSNTHLPAEQKTRMSTSEHANHARQHDPLFPSAPYPCENTLTIDLLSPLMQMIAIFPSSILLLQQARREPPILLLFLVSSGVHIPSAISTLRTASLACNASSRGSRPDLVCQWHAADEKLHHELLQIRSSSI